MTRTSSPESSFKLWAEPGFNRFEIGRRMQAAASNLVFFSHDASAPIRRIPPHALMLPELPKDPANATRAINAQVERYGIDALWVQDTAEQDLSGVDCEVHAAATPEVIELVNDKVKFSEWLGDDPFRANAVEAIGAKGIARQYKAWQQQGREMCVKPSVGSSGNGFWRLSEAAGASFLNYPANAAMHPEVYLHALEMAERESGPERFIAMDWLPGPEVSVDMLAWHGEPVIHAARTKIDDNRRQIVQGEHETIEHAQRMTRELGLHGIVSVQYRMDPEHNWKMLEINPRPAAGSINSQDAGYGIIDGWAKLVTDRVAPDELEQQYRDVTLEFVRTPRVVEGA